MNTAQLKTLDITIETLEAIRNCAIENADIHDHYDCRNDMKTAVTNLTNLLKETEA